MQEAYETACKALFAALDKLEERLQNQRYLVEYYPTAGVTSYLAGVPVDGDGLHQRQDVGQAFTLRLVWVHAGSAPSATLADWRLFTTLLRFDPVYYPLFKCNLRRLRSYPALRVAASQLAVSLSLHWKQARELH